MLLTQPYARWRITLDEPHDGRFTHAEFAYTGDRSNRRPDRELDALIGKLRLDWVQRATVRGVAREDATAFDRVADVLASRGARAERG